MLANVIQILNIIRIFYICLFELLPAWLFVCYASSLFVVNIHFNVKGIQFINATDKIMRVRQKVNLGVKSAVSKGGHFMKFNNNVSFLWFENGMWCCFNFDALELRIPPVFLYEKSSSSNDHFWKFSFDHPV